MQSNDLTQLAINLSAMLAPFLPYLLKGVNIIGKQAAKKMGEKFTEEGWAKAKKIWKKLFPNGFEENEEVHKRLTEYAPLDNDTTKETMVSYELNKALQNLTDQEIQIIDEIVRIDNSESNIAIAIGERSFVNIGDIKGATIITGSISKLPKEKKKKK